MSRAPLETFWVDRSDRSRLLLTGPDRAKFLHNLCTNDVKALKPGGGCEAFITNLQGKTLGYVTILAGADDLLLRTDPGGLEHVLPHFAKYGVFDEVAWVDLSDSTFEIHVVGEEALARVLAGLNLNDAGAGDLHHGEGAIRVVREAPFGTEGRTFVGERDRREDVVSLLTSTPPLSAGETEGWRIESGLPAFGREVTPENLPQEIGRDSRAISFVKGCYLGQETVARLDALGHVNKILKGLRTGTGALPPPGSSLRSGPDKAGIVTSSARFSGTGQGVALAVIRVKHAAPGTVLSWVSDEAEGEAIVADLPMIPMAEPPGSS